ncbi:ArgE/DapE family deacylase [soil metagenome]
MSTAFTNREIVSQLWTDIERRGDELVDLVSNLVRIPSMLGDEAPVQHWIANYMRASGLQTDVWDLDQLVTSLPNAGNSGFPFAGRPNVTGIRKGSGTGRSLIMNGHVDVVSPDPVNAWNYDPWGAEIVGNRMYGRGAYDMKSGVALNLFLGRLLNDLDIPLAGDFTLHSVIEEECTGNGALAAARRDRADAVIVTEPSFSAVTMAHLGVIWFKVHITGRSAHAGWAWQGVNAISKAVPVIQALHRLNDSFNDQVHPLYADQHHPINLNIGVIQGGDWPSTVPGSCTLHCRVSFFPDVKIESLRQQIEDTVAQASATDEWLTSNPPIVTYDGFHTAGSSLDDDEPFLAVLEAAHSRSIESPLGRRYATAVNDMRYYIFEGMPATCYGAEGGNGHAADEWLNLDSLQPVAKSLADFIVNWCGIE